MSQTKKKTYSVTVTRTAVQTKTFEVRAPTPREAKCLAMELAGDEDFRGTETSAEYDAEDVREVGEAQ